MFFTQNVATTIRTMFAPYNMNLNALRRPHMKFQRHALNTTWTHKCCCLGGPDEVNL